MTYYHVIKPDGSYVQVVLFRHKNTEQWSFVNLTKQHICTCRFNSKEDALADMEQHGRGVQGMDAA